MDKSINDEYQFDDMILSVCQSFIKTRSILKLKEQIALYQDHLSLLLQVDSYAKDNKKVEKNDYLFQTTQNDTLRLQISGSRDENENHRASKTEESAKD